MNHKKERFLQIVSAVLGFSCSLYPTSSLLGIKTNRRPQIEQAEIKVEQARFKAKQIKFLRCLSQKIDDDDEMGLLALINMLFRAPHTASPLRKKVLRSDDTKYRAVRTILIEMDFDVLCEKNDLRQIIVDLIDNLSYDAYDEIIFEFPFITTLIEYEDAFRHDDSSSDDDFDVNLIDERNSGQANLSLTFQA